MVNLPYWGWEQYNQSYYKIGFQKGYHANWTYIYYRTSDYAVVFTENRYVDYDSANVSEFNYFQGGLTNRNFLDLPPTYEDFLPPQACKWAYDKYPELGGNGTHNDTDD